MTFFPKTMPRLGRFFCILSLAAAAPAWGQVIQIDDRMELFADDLLVESTKGDIQRVLQKPVPGEVVFNFDAPWESSTAFYVTVFKDGDLYRMYYRGGPGKKANSPEETKSEARRKEIICYAESNDGIHWKRPELDLFEVDGNKANNVVWTGDSAGHNMAPFKDGNPEATPEARYKAIGQTRGSRAYQSADGIHWSLTEDRALVTRGTFDSHNLAFWDSFRQEYRMYWRFNPMSEGGAFHDRAIRTAVSKDFKTWERIADLQYPGKPEPQKWEETAQLYTSGILPYFRAPHLFIGFPSRFLLVSVGRAEGKTSYSMEPLFMMSRDGVRFHRWDDAVIPQDAPADRKGNRSNAVAWGMVQLPGKEDEMVIYAIENYMGKTPVRLRLFTYRLDGFVALAAGAEGGEVLTPALLFEGRELRLNYRTREGGELRVEIQDENGAPLQGFRLEDCEPLKGDDVRGVVRWKGGLDLSGAPSQESIRLRFVMKNAELFSMQFQGAAK